ncbi:hypothetical protein C8Q77DRAFT_824269 [Trametes polyzona]|nr:hypothetical protein C8Q77DRAFT_824269 [Trametes polyzona]
MPTLLLRESVRLLLTLPANSLFRPFGYCYACRHARRLCFCAFPDRGCADLRQSSATSKHPREYGRARPASPGALPTSTANWKVRAFPEAASTVPSLASGAAKRRRAGDREDEICQCFRLRADYAFLEPVLRRRPRRGASSLEAMPVPRNVAPCARLELTC